MIWPRKTSPYAGREEALARLLDAAAELLDAGTLALDALAAEVRLRALGAAYARRHDAPSYLRDDDDDDEETRAHRALLAAEDELIDDTFEDLGIDGEDTNTTPKDNDDDGSDTST